MTRILIVLACACFLGLFVGCSACNPAPDMVIKWPVQFQKQPATVRGPDYIQGPPTIYAPTYAPVAPAAPPAGIMSAPCAP